MQTRPENSRRDLAQPLNLRLKLLAAKRQPNTAQGQERSDAALGYDPQNGSESPEGATKWTAFERRPHVRRGPAENARPQVPAPRDINQPGRPSVGQVARSGDLATTRA